MNKKLPQRLFLLVICFICIGVYCNFAEAGAGIKVKVENNKIVRAEGNGVLAIGKNIKVVYLGTSLWKGELDVTGFKVDSGNKYFSAVDGVLFNKDKSELVYYPNARKGASYTVKKTVNTINGSAFSYNKHLKDIAIKNGVKNIGSDAFACSNVKNVTIPGSVSSIGGGLFSGCEKLEKVVCDADISSITSGMFSGCSSLKTFKIPDSVSKIMEFAFKGCKELEVKIGKKISHISNTEAFYDAAVSFEVDKDNAFYKSIDGVLY